ncbi:hypothetical protein PYW07_011464 [Mythimna separata]|uniref:PiggyBac transposable element-derived protein domain-containing protein n=1 Tax=Mythimna separata TaxID=271217 RepID=A0AAD8DL92_MYTSE|nr:hypothetical protein PYW07_011464 [Mythimna separata]
MSRGRLPQSAIEDLLREDEEESESELSDHGSETSDHIIAEEPRSAEESNCSDSEEDDLPLSEINSYFTGRDKVTKWQKSNNNRVRRQVQNILTEDAGIRRNGVGVTTFTEAWSLFISENIIEKVVRCTNEFIQKKTPSYNRIRDCKPTDAVEIRALLGLLYIAGSLKASHANLEDLYSSDGTGIPIFPTTMSVKRVKFLLNSLRFDDATTRQARRTLDKAAPIREVLDMFTQNCLLPYSVGENVVIDEMMVGFRGKCPFRQYMKSKPDKYGIKLYPLVDAATFYVLNIELYAGKQPEGPYQLSNAAADVVKRLFTPISGTGRNLTIDNWYSSVTLMNDLAKDHKISGVGTMRKNKKEIPPCFIDKNRPEYSSQFGFSDTATLVSYVPKKKRSVVLISSLHSAAEIDESTNEKRKPSIVTFYNKTKGGVDEVDKKAKMYSVSRKNNRWPLTLFFRLLDIAGINSMVILRANNVVIRKRRMYLRALGTELTKEYVQRRSTMLGLPRKLKRNIREHLNMEDSAAETEASSSGTSRATCKICPAKKRRQSKTQCKLCMKNICRSHTTFICNQCYMDEETDSNEN